MEYFQTTSSINATLSILMGATPGLTHFLTGIVASYSLVPAAGRLMVLDGSTAIFDMDIFVQTIPPIILPLINPLHGTQGNSLEIRLGAGGLLNLGKLNSFGFSLF